MTYLECVLVVFAGFWGICVFVDFMEWLEWEHPNVHGLVISIIVSIILGTMLFFVQK